MQIVTNGKNLELTAAIKDHVQQKMSRLENHYDFIHEIHVILELEKNPRIHENQLAEATVHVNGAIIRVEAATQNLYASIDLLVDKIERALKKHKTKLSKTHETIRRDAGETVTDAADELEDDDEELLYITLEGAETIALAESKKP